MGGLVCFVILFFYRVLVIQLYEKIIFIVTAKYHNPIKGPMSINPADAGDIGNV